MYMKQQQEQQSAIDFYSSKQESSPPLANNMIIQLPVQSHHHHHHHLIDTGGGGATSSGDDPTTTPTAAFASPNPPSKKRAETWVQDEIRALISLRKEIDLLFNTSKSNKHLWDDISLKMREKGFDRSPTMCTDKWRNLLKEYKKAKHNSQDGSGNGTVKMNYYKDIEQILRERSKQGPSWKNSAAPSNSAGAVGGSKVDSFMHFADKEICISQGRVDFDGIPPILGCAGDQKAVGHLSPGLDLDPPCAASLFPQTMTIDGIDDTSLNFGPVEANGRGALNSERSLDHEGHPLAITAAEAVGACGASPWNWREAPENGEHSNTYYGRVITVKFGDYTKRIGIDGSPDAIKEAIKSAFGLRTRRAFWLEDEGSVVRALDREMPVGNYTLHVDEGLAIKICFYGESEHLPVHTEDKTFYSDDDFHEFLSRRGWTCLRDNGFRIVDTLDDLCPGAIYRGVGENRL